MRRSQQASSTRIASCSMACTATASPATRLQLRCALCTHLRSNSQSQLCRPQAHLTSQTCPVNLPVEILSDILRGHIPHPRCFLTIMIELVLFRAPWLRFYSSALCGGACMQSVSTDYYCVLRCAGQSVSAHYCRLQVLQTMRGTPEATVDTITPAVARV